MQFGILIGTITAVILTITDIRLEYALLILTSEKSIKLYQLRSMNKNTMYVSLLFKSIPRIECLKKSNQRVQQPEESRLAIDLSA